MKVGTYLGRGTLAAVLALAVSGAAAAATVTVGPVVEVSGTSPFVACNIAGQIGTNYLNSEVEPYVATNPANAANIVGAWQQDRWSNGGSRGLVAGFSFNGGKTWGQTPLPFSKCAPGGLNYERASDPWVSIGPDGTVYTNAISFDHSTFRNAVAAATSNDGGKTWGNLVVLVSFETTGSQFSTDKNSITADPVQSGVAYSVWDTLASPTDQPDDNPHAAIAAAFTGPAFFSKTTDFGAHWSAPQMIVNTGNRQQTIGNQIVVDPRTGVLYDFFNLILPPDANSSTAPPKNTNSNLAFVQSSDGGTTWTRPHVVDQINTVFVSDPNTGAAIRTGDIIPEVAINPTTGQLYAVWQDADFTHQQFDQVAFSTSTDGGVHWTPKIRVNTPTGRPAFTPQVHANSDGTIGVTYYDFRNLAAGNTTTLPTDYWLTISTDGGQTFGNEVHVKGPFDMMTAPNARGFFVGDYEGLDNIGTAFRPFFVAANSGNLNNRTDVFTTGAAAP